MTTKTGTVIRVEYSLDSLGGISRTAFEAELYDALKEKWPGATVNVVLGIDNKYWGVIDDEEIDSESIRWVSEQVFTNLCPLGRVDPAFGPSPLGRAFGRRPVIVSAVIRHDGKNWWVTWESEGKMCQRRLPARFRDPKRWQGAHKEAAAMLGIARAAIRVERSS